MSSLRHRACRRGLLALIASSIGGLLAAPTHSQCVSGNGYSANFHSVRIVVSGSARALVAGGDATIQAGYGQWNNAPCVNSSPAPIPEFTSSGGAMSIIVYAVDSVSPLIRGRHVCAAFQHDFNLIRLFTKIPNPAGGPDLTCDYSQPDKVSDVIAHELGHFLGLGESGCGGHIMGPAAYRATNGTAIDVTPPRSITMSECDRADLNSFTPEEDAFEQQMCSLDPDCNPYSPCIAPCVSPIVLDLDLNRFRFSGLGNPVTFDVDADGEPDRTAWTRRRQLDAFLCLDRNGNGVVDDGGELFGTATRLADGRKARNGYVALAELDRLGFGGNNDGTLTAEDALWSQLGLWVDFNHDGVATASERLSPDEIGLVEIELAHRRVDRLDRHGNWLAFGGRAWIDTPSGRIRIRTVDVYFRVEE